METLRRVYGIAEPVRRGMELKIVREGEFRPAVLGGGKQASLHEDILVLGGRDTEVGWEDVFQGMWFRSLLSCLLVLWKLDRDERLTDIPLLGDEFREPPTFHDEMEKRLKMDW